MTAIKNFSIFLLFSLFFAACGDDDSATPDLDSATFQVTIENTLPEATYLQSGTTNFLAPGESQQITFHAGQGTFLSFNTMFVQSNDLFYAFDESGLRLYDDSGIPVTGDVTAMANLWDAGTEVNEEPGVGPNQAPRQSGPDTGMDENGVVQMVSDAFTYPSDEDVIRLTLDHDGGTQYTFTIENVSGASSLPTPLAPGVWAVHGTEGQFFTAGQPASLGLERIAEDGDNSISSAEVGDDTGYTSPLAPGVWAVHRMGQTPLFISGASDSGEGLEALAEDGDPAPLNNSLDGDIGVLSNGVFNTPVGSSGPGPLLPGNSYTFTFTAVEGDHLSLATMLVQTNDLFYGFGQNGIALFINGTAFQGDLTDDIQLWDAGTEVNEYPGAGNNQPPRGGADSGPDENGTVRPVNDGFTYPAVNDAIRVTIEVVQ